MGRWSQYSLSAKQRNAVLKAIRAEGRKPPKVGYCVKALGGEVCRHRRGGMGPSDTGYQVIGVEKPAGFDGYRRRRRRR